MTTIAPHHAGKVILMTGSFTWFHGATAKGSSRTRLAASLSRINCTFVVPQAVVWRYDPPYKLAGRVGALRIRTGRTLNDADLVIIGAYAPQTTAPEESLSAFWDAVHSVFQQVPARSTVLCGIDANGDPTFAEDAYVGPRYPTDEPSANGDRLRELCVPNGLLVLDTWKSSIRGLPPDEWNGCTFWGVNGERTRPDHILARCEQNMSPVTVLYDLGFALKPGNGTVMLDHAPLAVDFPYEVKLKPRQTSHTDTAWHFGSLRHALADCSVRAPFLQDVEAWHVHNSEVLSRCAAEDDPSRAWNLLNDGLMHIAKRHFTVCSGGSKPWMSAATWDLIQRRDHQLKAWAAHVCLVRVGVAQVFQAWSRCSWLGRMRRAIRRACVADKRAHIDSLANDMDAAARHGHWRQVWRVGRAIARTGLGPKRRVYRPPDAEPISAEEWDAYMQQAFRAEPMPACLPVPRCEASRHPAHMNMPSLRNFCRNILSAGNNRSVPAGSLPSEVWKLVFGYLPALARDIYEQFFRQLARTGRNPGRWYDVPIPPIDKGNGKPKCQGKRPIARLDSLAKQVHKTFYQACATTPRPDWAFGCIRGRRREEASAIVENNMFRCRRSKRNHAVFFRDAANAFPSLSHEAIARHVRSQGAAHDLIMDARANSLLGLQVSGSGVRKWCMGRGTRQGDTIAGDVFMNVYHVPLQAYKTATQDDDLLLEYGNDVIDAAMTTYADDIAELMVADSAEELLDKAVTRAALLEAELGGVGCQLEPSKEEVIMRWTVAGAHANRKTAMMPNKVTPGKKIGVARYLGGWVHNNGNKNTEIDKRISAMRMGFWAYAGVWRCQNVSLRAKRLFFKAMVQGAGLSGLEPYLLPKTALLRLERARDHLARRALGRAGWGAVHGDPHHESVPNSLIRARMRVHTIASTLRQRRLRWLQHMVRHPNHHKLYFASMFGRFGWEVCRRELDDCGKPVQHAVPALRQMYEDLAAAVPEFRGRLPSVIFEHLVTARVQWIEAPVTQALPSSSQRDMWIGSGSTDTPMQQAEQSKRARTEDPTANHKKLVRTMENLDYRLRQLEGATPCFFLPWRDAGKGKPHPDKRRKTTLAGALVKFAAERELQRLTPEEQAALAQT
ncbi:unnamed protein product, partial [Symbiodinium microadriaticum]